MNPRARAVSFALIVSAAFAATSSFADTHEDTTEQAKAHFRRGVTLYAEQDYRAALIQFRRAYQMSPSFAVLFNIGQASYQLLDYASALRALERYLAEGDATIPSARRAAVEKEIAELRERVATLTVRTNVDDVEIAIDDEPVGHTPFTAPLTVGAGRRKITATKSGRTPVTRYVDVAGGDGAEVVLDLAEPGQTRVVSAPREVVTERPIAPTSTPEPHSVSPVAYVGLGVAALGIGVGAMFGGLALGEKSALDGLCVDHTCNALEQHRIDRLQQDALVSTIGFGVGAVGLATAIYLFVTAPHASTESAASSRLEPWIGPRDIGLRGRF